MNLLNRRRTLIANTLSKIDQFPYVFVEYLEGTGTQYIDTGFIPKNKPKTDVEYQFVDTSVSTTQCVFGVNNSSSSYSRYMWSYNGSSISGLGNTYSIANPKLGLDISRHVAVVDAVTPQMLLDGASLPLNVVEGSKPEYRDDNTNSVFLFARNATSNRPSAYFKGRIFSCKQWQNGVLLQDLRPCYRRSDNVPGMYDILNDVFYTNAGTGEFILGPNV